MEDLQKITKCDIINKILKIKPKIKKCDLWSSDKGFLIQYYEQLISEVGEDEKGNK